MEYGSSKYINIKLYFRVKQLERTNNRHDLGNVQKHEQRQGIKRQIISTIPNLHTNSHFNFNTEKHLYTSIRKWYKAYYALLLRYLLLMYYHIVTVISKMGVSWWRIVIKLKSIQGPFSVSYLEQAQAVLGQSQGRLLQKPDLWLAEHSLSLLRARYRKRALIDSICNIWGYVQVWPEVGKKSARHSF